MHAKFCPPRSKGSKVIANSDRRTDRQTIFIKYVILPLLKNSKRLTEHFVSLSVCFVTDRQTKCLHKVYSFSSSPFISLVHLIHQHLRFNFPLILQHFALSVHLVAGFDKLPTHNTLSIMITYNLI
jgi:hypothetical protein